jgi:hypothetical protein
MALPHCGELLLGEDQQRLGAAPEPNHRWTSIVNDVLADPVLRALVLTCAPAVSRDAKLRDKQFIVPPLSGASDPMNR